MVEEARRGIFPSVRSTHQQTWTWMHARVYRRDHDFGEVLVGTKMMLVISLVCCSMLLISSKFAEHTRKQEKDPENYTVRVSEDEAKAEGR